MSIPNGSRLARWMFDASAAVWTIFTYGESDISSGLGTTAFGAVIPIDCILNFYFRSTSLLIMIVVCRETDFQGP